MDLSGGAGIAGALVGGIAGAQGSRTSQDSMKILLPESQYEKQGGQVAGDMLSQFQGLIGKGPGEQDMQAGVDSSRSLAQLLGQFAQGGFLPSQQDYGFANQLTQNVFAPEQTALAQRFQDAQRMGNRQAAQMGRAGNDPILLNKLLQEQTRQQQMLQSQMTSFGAQQAMNMPMQRLQFAQQLAQVNNGLASQAMQNRQALFGMGSQLRSQEQAFRANTASTQTSQSSGGGLGGALTGALAGAGMGVKAGNSLNSMFSDFSMPSMPSLQSQFSGNATANSSMASPRVGGSPGSQMVPF